MGGPIFYSMALKASGAVQAARWSKMRNGGGYIYSFNTDRIRCLSIRSARCVRWRSAIVSATA